MDSKWFSNFRVMYLYYSKTNIKFKYY
jgi:hypothetical protein